MLDLLAFDLDGTLADTEPLKAQSYGWAAHRLRPDVAAADVEAAYVPYVGCSRHEIASGLLDRFGLGDAARARDASAEPWQTFVGLRLDGYRAMLADGALVRRHAHAEVVTLARRGRTLARSVALVTTTDRRNADAVLAALGLSDAFDVFVTADDVARPKPDPEPYRLALSCTGADATAALALEDSPAGIRGALAAGVAVLAMPTADTEAAVAAMVAAGELDRADVIALGDVTARVEAAAAR